MKKCVILFLLKGYDGGKIKKGLKKEKRRVLVLPRIARDYNKLKVYHTIIRGIDKQDIFYSEKDRVKFIEIIKVSKEKYNYELYAYCLMDNHVHLVIYDKNEEISKIMQSIQVRYVMYFNRKYDRIGHLFQNRFFSKKVEDRQYLKNLCRYIHQNPLKAGIAKTEEYKWSSYKSYIRFNKLIDTRLLLLTFSDDEKEAKEEFKKFHNINANDKQSEINDMIEYEMYEAISDEDVGNYICEILKINNVREILKFNREIRNENLLKLKRLKNIPAAQLARVIGINRKIIERL